MQTFKAQVNVVSVFFNVKDHHGLLIPGLNKTDFEVIEDGKPQTVKYFSRRLQPAADARACSSTPVPARSAC